MREGSIYRGQGEYYGVVNNELFNLLSGETMEEIPENLEECTNLDSSFQTLVDLAEIEGETVDKEKVFQIKKDYLRMMFLGF